MAPHPEIALPDWSGRTILIVASGQSAAFLAPALRGLYPTIAINLSVRLIPDADILYAADAGFWSAYRGELLNFCGLKLAADEAASRIDSGVFLVNIRDGNGPHYQAMRREPIGSIGVGGGNSGFQALNLGAQLVGPGGRVLLAGYDMQGPHWHANHPPSLRNPSTDQLNRWRLAMDAAAPVLEDWGVDVVNLSATSALKGFRKAIPHDVYFDKRNATI
jgi:hypothetical protein